MAMNVCVLYSGGKDSNLALYKASKEMKIKCLVTVKPESEESWLFHYPAVDIVKYQSKALGIPLILDSCRDDEESSIKALYNVLEKAIEIYSVDGVVTGAVKSTYQATRFQRICWDLGLWCFNPLWQINESKFLHEIVNSGFEVIFTRVAGYPLKKELVGRKFTWEVVEMLLGLKEYINPSGEGGEYETLVLDMPMFRRKIEVEYEVYGSDYDASIRINEVRLIEK
jgi:ABC transporter with metal-binding/Fe-S-binding domain ATP-binding protein